MSALARSLARVRSPERNSILLSIAAILGVHAEDAAGGTNTITPEALKVFLESNAPQPEDVQARSPLIHLTLPVIQTQSPPEIALSPPQQQRQDPRPNVGGFGGFDDIRLDSTMGIARYTLNSGSSRITTDGHDHHAGRVSMAWLGSPGLAANGGFLLGLSCADQWSRSDDAITMLALRQYSVDVHAGYGCPWGRNFQCEAVPFLGVLVAHGSIDSMTTIRGYGVDWGLRIAGVYTWDAGLQFGLIVDYRGSSVSARASDGTRFSMRASGLSYGVIVGERF